MFLQKSLQIFAPGDSPPATKARRWPDSAALSVAVIGLVAVEQTQQRRPLMGAGRARLAELARGQRLGFGGDAPQGRARRQGRIVHAAGAVEIVHAHEGGGDGLAGRQQAVVARDPATEFCMFLRKKLQIFAPGDSPPAAKAGY